MVRLLGPQDRLLTTIEHEFPEVTVLVRGNLVTLEGPAEQVAAAERLVAELIQMVRNGVDLGSVDVTSSARILERGEGSPAEVLSQAILGAEEPDHGHAIHLQLGVRAAVRGACCRR